MTNKLFKIYFQIQIIQIFKDNLILLIFFFIISQKFR